MSGADKLACALVAMAKAAGCVVRVAPASEERWASATFVGAMHVLTIDGRQSTAFDAWLETLRDGEVFVRGYVVADVAVERQAGGARVTALMLVAA